MPEQCDRLSIPAIFAVILFTDTVTAIRLGRFGAVLPGYVTSLSISKPEGLYPGSGVNRFVLNDVVERDRAVFAGGL